MAWDAPRIRMIGFFAMCVAPVVTLVRALLAALGIAEPSFYWVFFALGGSLSAIGILLVAMVSYRSFAFPWVLLGAAVAGIGHYILPETRFAIMGPSLVQLGTGILVAPWRAFGLASGIVAAAGAYLRHPEPIIGNVLLLAGAAGLLAALLEAGMRSGRDMQPSE